MAPSPPSSPLVSSAFVLYDADFPPLSPVCPGTQIQHGSSIRELNSSEPVEETDLSSVKSVATDDDDKSAVAAWWPVTERTGYVDRFF